MSELLLHFYCLNGFAEVNTAQYPSNSMTIGSGTQDAIRPDKLPLAEQHLTLKRDGFGWLIAATGGSVILQSGKPLSNNPEPLETDKVYILTNREQKVSLIARKPSAYPEPETAFELDSRRENTLGRNDKSTIWISDRMVSDKHATCLLQNGHWVLRDENSTNGVFLNGHKTREAILHEGDRITISGHKFRFQNGTLLIPIENGSIIVNGLNSKKKKSRPYPWFQLSPRFLHPMPEGEITIPAPTTAMTQPTINWVMVLLPSVSILLVSIVISISMGGQSGSPLFMLASTATSLLVSVLGYNFQKKKYHDSEENRVREYEKVIDSKLESIKKAHESQKLLMNENSPAPTECIEIAEKRNRRLWERTDANTDFLKLRLGLGISPLSTSVKFPESQGQEDALVKKTRERVAPLLTLQNVPVSISLQETPTIGLIGSSKDVAALGRSLLIHLATLHTYDEMKLVLVTSPSSIKEWHWARWLPHTWDENQENRFFIGDKSSGSQILNLLTEKIQLREHLIKGSNQFSSDYRSPAYVFFITDPNLLRNEPIARYLSSELGVFSIYLGESLEKLPRNCDCVIKINDKQGEIVLQKNARDRILFSPDETGIDSAELFARSLAPVKISNLSRSQDIPKRVTFLEMMHISRVEELDLTSFWKSNRTDESLIVPVGFKEGAERMVLDLQEGDGKDGPHSLVAGTSGSGKSEFLQTLILSLAVQYSPANVNFVIIDYKGGSMARCFSQLPHLAGIITNLGGNQTHRALLSVQGEIKRREEILAKSGDKDINSYQKQFFMKQRTEPLPHLFIIVDEFAELKKERPEFIDGLISASRKGRSLGIKLILATQSPGGVIDKAIRDNTRLYACLQVKTDEDSKEMIGSVDASLLTLAGRVIARSDQRMIQFQSAWSGASYQRSDLSRQKVPIYEVEANGKRQSLSRSYFHQDTNTWGNEMEAIIDHLVKTAEKIKLPTSRTLWTEPLPTQIALPQLIGAVTQDLIEANWLDRATWMKPVVALVDQPSQQTQFAYAIDFIKNGHIAVLGMPSSGKTTLLKTLIMHTAIQNSPEDVWMYLLDFGGRTMKVFEGLPQVGAVITPDMSDEIRGFGRLISGEMEMRKRQFASLGVSTIKAYRQTSGNKLPAILVIIDQYTVFLDMLPDMEDLILRISSEGGNLGIFLALSGNTLSSLKYRLTSNISNMLALQFADRSEYAGIIGSGRLAIEPEAHPGRGLLKAESGLEFQTLLPAQGETEAQQNESVKALTAMMSQLWRSAKAKKIATCPPVLSLDYLYDLYQEADHAALPVWSIPAGILTSTVEVHTLDLSQTTHILATGLPKSGKTTCLKGLLASIIKYHGDSARIYIADSARKDFRTFKDQTCIRGYSSSKQEFSTVFSEMLKDIEAVKNDLFHVDEESEHIENRKNDQIFFFISDFSECLDRIELNEKAQLENIIRKGRLMGVHVITAANAHEIAGSWDGPAKAIRDFATGITFSDQCEQQVFNARLPTSEANRPLKMGEGFCIDKSSINRVKWPIKT